MPARELLRPDSRQVIRLSQAEKPPREETSKPHAAAPLKPPPASELDRIAAEIAEDAAVDLRELSPEQREYLKEHALKKPLGVLQIWSLGVGAVITGEYFGWNLGLAEGGPLAMLLAAIFVCVLYTTWVLALSELSVAMPFAGGPLAYGRQAVGPGFGFLMGWSMFLESLFATIGTAIATGGAVYFLVNLLVPGYDPDLVKTICALLTVLLFALVQWIGAQQQAKVMEWMTYGAILGLIWFWIAAAPGVDLDNIFTSPLLPHGWEGVLRSIPYAIWFLVIIESVALAAEEAHEPHRTIPRGLLLAQLTLIVLVIVTWFFVCGSGDYKVLTKTSYPLQYLYGEIWSGGQHAWHLIGFCVVALCGMVASYNGMLFAVSRQSFSLGRAGYLPRVLGHVHEQRRTPDVSIFFWSLVIGGFVVWSYFDSQALDKAVLTCNLTALVWYVLAMVCLFVLRIKEPEMHRPYRVPWYPLLPAAVLVMSLFAALVYSRYNDLIVLKLTGVMYAAGLVYYLAWARTRLASAAPEELAARGNPSR